MKNHRFSDSGTGTFEKERPANILFPIVIFCFFAVFAILVILLGARVYESTVTRSGANYTARTSIAYLTEKVRQNDRSGSVSVGTFDGRQALILRSPADADDSESAVERSDNAGTGNTAASGIGSAAANPSTDAVSEAYTTYIYAENGNLMELTVLDGADISADNGTAILPLADLEIRKDSPNLLAFTCTDADGNTESACVALRAEEVEQ